MTQGFPHTLLDTVKFSTQTAKQVNEVKGTERKLGPFISKMEERVKACEDWQEDWYQKVKRHNEQRSWGGGGYYLFIVTVLLLCLTPFLAVPQ